MSERTYNQLLDTLTVIGNHPDMKIHQGDIKEMMLLIAKHCELLNQVKDTRAMLENRRRTLGITDAKDALMGG